MQQDLIYFSLDTPWLFNTLLPTFLSSINCWEKYGTTHRLSVLVLQSGLKMQPLVACLLLSNHHDRRKEKALAFLPSMYPSY